MLWLWLLSLPPSTRIVTPPLPSSSAPSSLVLRSPTARPLLVLLPILPFLFAVFLGPFLISSPALTCLWLPVLNAVPEAVSLPVLISFAIITCFQSPSPGQDLSHCIGMRYFVLRMGTATAKQSTQGPIRTNCHTFLARYQSAYKT